ncbi:MAG TPA: tRNA-modifying protein YgfZ, partial [Plasticicumulans sp.]|nr:tRNA-modifying protein YgfZ [Plasticicumulans sp.]
RIDALQQALLAAGARAATAEDWAALDIAAGIAEVHGPLVEAFVPQMLNLDRTDGISFSKGCYTGQEIVARVHYLGQIKQRLYRAHVDAPAAPAVAEALIADQAGPNEQAGQIVSVAADPAGGWQMLAVVTTQLAARDAVRLADGTPLRLQPLHAGQDT